MPTRHGGAVFLEHLLVPQAESRDNHSPLLILFQASDPLSGAFIC